MYHPMLLRKKSNVIFLINNAKMTSYNNFLRNVLCHLEYLALLEAAIMTVRKCVCNFKTNHRSYANRVSTPMFSRSGKTMKAF